MSGHSKWATIKHKKGALDAKRGKLFTKLIKELTVAARMGGGEPMNNPRLRTAIQAAKGQSMPGDTIKNAVKRGTGEMEGLSYDEVLYEGTGPQGTLFLVEGATDNKTAPSRRFERSSRRTTAISAAPGSRSGRSIARVSSRSRRPPRTKIS